MKRLFCYVFPFLVSSIFLLSTTSVSAAPAPDPTEQFRPFVERIVSILTDPNLQGEDM